MFKILKPHKWGVALFLGGSLAAALFDGISIGVLIPLIDRLQKVHNDPSELGVFGKLIHLLESFPPETQILFSIGLVICAVLLKNLLFGLSVTKGVWLSNKVAADIRLKAMRLLLRVGIGFHYKSEVGSLIEKATQFPNLLKDLLLNLSQFFVFLFILNILLVLMLIVSWPLTVFALVLGMAGMWLMSLYLKNMISYGEHTARTQREMTQSVHETLGAIKLIHSYSKQEQQYAVLKDRITEFQTADNRVAYRTKLAQPLTEGLGVIAMSILLVGSLILAPTGKAMVLAQLLPFLYVLLRVITTLKILNDSLGTVRARWPYLMLIHDLIRTDDKPFVEDGKEVFGGIRREITFDHVSFAYEKGRDVLNDIHFSIPRGKTTAIIGESGVGKSTVLDLLLRFFEPRGGEIRIDGHEITSFNCESYRRHFGVVSQDTFLFNASVRDNIAFGKAGRVAESEIIEAAKRAGAHDFVMRLSDGYDTVIGERGVKLSGGERQRISIARAIIKDPPILILDEATNALDLAAEQRIRKTIAELSRDRTVITIAHRTSAIEDADQIVVLKEGRVTEMGDAEHLIEQRGEYFRLTQVE